VAPGELLPLRPDALRPRHPDAHAASDRAAAVPRSPSGGHAPVKELQPVPPRPHAATRRRLRSPAQTTWPSPDRRARPAHRAVPRRVRRDLRQTQRVPEALTGHYQRSVFRGRSRRRPLPAGCPARSESPKQGSVLPPLVVQGLRRLRLPAARRSSVTSIPKLKQKELASTRLAVVPSGWSQPLLTDDPVRTDERPHIPTASGTPAGWSDPLRESCSAVRTLVVGIAPAVSQRGHARTIPGSCLAYLMSCTPES
jgi:hypothetical protein